VGLEGIRLGNGFFAIGRSFYDVILQFKVVLEAKPYDFFVFYDENLVLYVIPPF
jgi:hypothetical protein